jgi:hypothetical protein
MVSRRRGLGREAMRWIFFHGVFGNWGWEQLDDTGGVVAESRVSFESRDEAEADAARRGYPRRGVHAAAPRSGATSNIRSAIAESVAPALKVALAPPSIHRPPAAELASSETIPSTR